MPPAEELAPEVPIVLAVTVALMLVLVYLVARGLIYVWKYSIGLILIGLSERLVIHIWRVHWDAGGWLRDANDAVIGWLGQLAGQSDRAAGRLFHAAGEMQRWVLREMAALARDTLHLGSFIVQGAIPKLWNRVVKYTLPAYSIYRLIDKMLAVNWHRIAHAVTTHVNAARRSILHELAYPYRTSWDWLVKHRHALDQVIVITSRLPAAIAKPFVHIFPRLEAIARWEGHTAKRLARLEGLLGAAGFAAVMANALGLPNWRCVTRGNLGKTSRAICAAPSDLIDDLLAALVDLLILENVCEIIPLVETAAETVGVPLVDALAGVANAGICHGASGAPRAEAPALFVPATPGFALHLPA